MQSDRRPRISKVPRAVRSAGADAIRLCEIAHLALDDWQMSVLDGALGEREDKTWSAFEVALICARQNGKSEVLVARMLAGAFLLGEQIIYSAHLFDSSMVIFRRLVGIVEDTPTLMRRVARINRAHGSESIELTSGARISFRTRTKLGARGHTSDLVVFDEAHILSQAALGSMLPTLSSRKRAQVWFAGTAVDQQINEDGVVLSSVRERALIGGDDAETLAFFEWSAPGRLEDATETSMSDLTAWAEANPAFPQRIRPEQIEREQAAMDPRTFCVERLGIGDWPRGDGLPGVLDAQAWRDCVDPAPVAVDPICFSFDVSPDRRHVAIAASWRGEDLIPRVDVIEQHSGTAGVPERLADLTSRHDTLAVVCDPAGPAASLLPELDRLGVKVELVTSVQHAQACGLFYDAVEQRNLRYRRNPTLDVAVENAVKRPLGDAGWAWSRKSSNVNIAPLVSVTLAHWGTQTIEPGYTGPIIEFIL